MRRSVPERVQSPPRPNTRPDWSLFVPRAARVSRLFRNVLLHVYIVSWGLGVVWPPWGPDLSIIMFGLWSIGIAPCARRSPASVPEAAPWMVRRRFPLGAWLRRYRRAGLVGLPGCRLCYRLVLELFVAVEDLDVSIKKYAYHDFVFGLRPRSVVLEDLVDAVVVAYGPVVL